MVTYVCGVSIDKCVFYVYIDKRGEAPYTVSRAKHPTSEEIDTVLLERYDGMIRIDADFKIEPIRTYKREKRERPAGPPIYQFVAIGWLVRFRYWAWTGPDHGRGRFDEVVITDAEIEQSTPEIK